MTDLDVVDVVEQHVTVQVLEPDVHVVEIIERGPQGPAGPVADINAILAHVDTAVQDYYVLHPQSWTYEQVSAVYVVDIVHPLDHRPTVVATDTAGDEWEAEVTYPAVNRVRLTYNLPFAGTITLT